MCGRFTIFTPISELAQWFDAFAPNEDFLPHFNAAPGQFLPVITQDKPQNIFLYKWGLIPHWAKEPKIGYRMINARAETISQKPAFRDNFKKNRCLILADGFFEWDKKGKVHTPYHFTLTTKEPFAFAGICDTWKDKKGISIPSFSIITTEANSLIKKVHDRMPVIIRRNDLSSWLAPEYNDANLHKLLKPLSSKLLEMRKISSLVNNPKNDSSEVIESKD